MAQGTKYTAEAKCGNHVGTDPQGINMESQERKSNQQGFKSTKVDIFTILLQSLAYILK